MPVETEDPKAALLERAKSILSQPTRAYRTQEAALGILPELVELIENQLPAGKAASAKIKEQADIIAALTAEKETLQAKNAELTAEIAVVVAAVNPPEKPVDPAADLGLGK